MLDHLYNLIESNFHLVILDFYLNVYKFLFLQV